jgi:hypothetical protein
MPGGDTVGAQIVGEVVVSSSMIANCSSGRAERLAVSRPSRSHRCYGFVEPTRFLNFPTPPVAVLELKDAFDILAIFLSPAHSLGTAIAGPACGVV